MMTVSDLISKLSTLDGNLPVVIDGVTLGLGRDFELAKVNKYDNCASVSLISGNVFEEDQE